MKGDDDEEEEEEEHLEWRGERGENGGEDKGFREHTAHP